MDLDKLAKDAATGSVSRRGALRRMLGGLAVGAGTVAVLERPALAAPKVSCPAGFDACTSATTTGSTSTVCRDTNADADNCGACGNKCQDWEICRSGVCRPVCPVGQHVCGSICTNLASDPNNCGACGTVCASGTCQNGTCSAACTTGQTRGCGTCGVGVCTRTGTQTCTAQGTWGSCVCTPGSPDPGSYCDGLDHNCDGVADTTCPSGMTCNNGVCSGQGCPSGQTLCGGVCRDLSGDPANCGTCGNACPSVVCRTAICAGGNCGYANQAAGTPCGTTTCTNGVMTTHACDGAGTCSSSSQSCGSYTCSPSGTCNTSCVTSVNCAAGNVCSNGVCLPQPG